LKIEDLWKSLRSVFFGERLSAAIDLGGKMMSDIFAIQKSLQHKLKRQYALNLQSSIFIFQLAGFRK